MSNKTNKILKARLGRRGFLKLIGITGAAVVAKGLIELVASNAVGKALAIPGEGPYYYGTDTSWSVDYYPNPSGFPQNFYIGRTGVGEVIYPSEDSGFYPDAAEDAGSTYTHTYWTLKGPYYIHRWDPGYRTAYEYGYDQGLVAASAWYDHDYSNLIGGKTIFADIEESTEPGNPEKFDGWRYESGGNYYIDYISNREVLNGFMDAVNEYLRNGQDTDFNPGIYTTLNLWQDWFYGTDGYSPAGSLVVWLAGGGTCSIPCSPCDDQYPPCSDAKWQADEQFDTVKETAFGNYKTIIWQFWLGGGACGACADYDIARQNGHVRFLPHQVHYLPLITRHQYEIESPDPYPPPGAPTPDPEAPAPDPYP